MSFVIKNDVQQYLKRELFGPGWVHICTVEIPASNISRQRVFMLLMNEADSQTYIEEYVDFPLFFIKIEDNNLWKELYLFFVENNYLKIGIGLEKKIVKNKP